MIGECGLGPRALKAIRERTAQPSETPTPWPDNAEPTDEQVAAWLTICTPAERLERVRWWREAAGRGWRCLTENHEARLTPPRPGTGRHRA